ncbi:MAG TPA: DPP IV N-terminal domain-containing protein, partial [Pyrinomonadaceae bacterium]
MKPIRFLSSFLLVLLMAAQLCAQQQAQPAESGLVTLDSVFTYRAKSLNAVQWQADGKGYLTLEPSASKREAPDIVRYDAASGERTILISAENLVPPGASAALVVEEFEVSPDGQKLLLFTNTARVWRSNTRGDYWVVDLKSWKLHKLGGDAKPSTLMFAKFSPDGTRAG